MSLLLIGGNSSLAKSFKSYLKKNSINIKYLESNRNLNSEIFLDLNNKSSFNNIPDNINIAIIFAGITSIDFCENHKNIAEKINLENTKILVEKLNNKNIKCLILSSSSVFGNSTQNNGEHDKKEPNTFYGSLKSQLEEEIKENKLNCIIRLTKVILPEMLLIRSWINDLKMNKSINAYSNLFISPISNISLNEMICDWVKFGYSGIYHLTSNNQLSYYDLIKYISKKLNLNHSKIKSLDCSDNLFFKPKKSYLDCKLPQSRSKILSNELINICKYYE